MTKKEKKYEIFLTIIGCLTLGITIVGMTFAYFTIKMFGEDATSIIKTGQFSNVYFDGGASFTNSDEIIPNWKETKTFTISSEPTDATTEIYVKLTYKNNMPELTCNVTGPGAIGNVDLKSDNIERTVTVVTKIIEASSIAQSYEYTMTMELPETGVPQDDNQGKNFSAMLFADLGEYDVIYYNNSNPGGTITKPTV